MGIDYASVIAPTIASLIQFLAFFPGRQGPSILITVARQGVPMSEAVASSVGSLALLLEYHYLKRGYIGRLVNFYNQGSSGDRNHPASVSSGGRLSQDTGMASSSTASTGALFALLGCWTHSRTALSDRQALTDSLEDSLLVASNWPRVALWLPQAGSLLSAWLRTQGRLETSDLRMTCYIAI